MVTVVYDEESNDIMIYIEIYDEEVINFFFYFFFF